MPRLVISPGTPQAWEIQLKPGINFLGRGPSNDFKIDDLSISGAHCQIVVDQGTTIIKDMGSTNGTFVNRAKVQESRLATGQPLRLGSVDMIFYADELVETNVVTAPPPPPPAAPALRASPLPVSAPPLPPVPAMKISDAPAAPALAPAPALRITGLAPAAASAPVSVLEAPPLVATMAATEAPSAKAIDVGRKFCKFHPKSPARYMCNKCSRTFCELCVTSLNIGGQTKKNCRSCGVECVPLQVHLVRPDAPKNFFASVPGAFVYPMRGSGIFILLAGMLIFAGIRLGNVMMSTRSVRGIGMGVIMQMILGGYLFTFLQNIIHSTAAGDEEVPDLPGMNMLEDIILPFLRLLGLVVVSFSPAIALMVLALATSSPIAATAVFPAILFCCLYFPMAFLAVAILDSVGAVNPLVILPSIMRVPVEYILTVVVLAAVLVFTKLGDFVLGFAFPKGLMTDSIGELIAMFALKFLWSLVSIYLLTVNARILGLLYLSKKDQLNWLGR